MHGALPRFMSKVARDKNCSRQIFVDEVVECDLTSESDCWVLSRTKPYKNRIANQLG
jgi:hypothetical protein